MLPILIHGDAAFAGQGVVMETLQLSQARGFYTGGTRAHHHQQPGRLHHSAIRAMRARRMYCSDVAKMIEAPIFHVNGDDPEAVVFVTRLALDYRHAASTRTWSSTSSATAATATTKRTSRAATQPMMYQAIRKHPTHAQALRGPAWSPRACCTDAEADGDDRVNIASGLDEGKPQARASLGMIGNKYTVDWTQVPRHRLDTSTCDRRSTSSACAHSANALDDASGRNFALHPRVAQVIANREKMLAGELPLDWGCAETLAYASMLERRQCAFASRARTAAAAPSSIATRCCTTSAPASATSRCSTSPSASRASQITDSVLSEEAVLRFRIRLSRPPIRPTLVIWEGAVRRLRERRAGDHRSVHQLGRSQVGPPVRTRAAPAARLRRPGPGALVGAPRALPAAVRREQHAGVRAVDAGADVPHAAPADAALACASRSS